MVESPNLNIKGVKSSSSEWEQIKLLQSGNIAQSYMNSTVRCQSAACILANG